MTKQDIRVNQIWRNKTTGLAVQVIGLAISGHPEDSVTLRTRGGVSSELSADELVETHACQVMGWPESASLSDQST